VNRMRLWSPLLQKTTPRFTPIELPSLNGSNVHFSAPVAASSANTLSVGEVPYRVPSAIRGLHWIWERFAESGSDSYSQAFVNCATLPRCICLSGEYCEFARSLPKWRHSLVAHRERNVHVLEAITRTASAHLDPGTKEWFIKERVTGAV